MENSANNNKQIRTLEEARENDEDENWSSDARPAPELIEETSAVTEAPTETIYRCQIAEGEVTGTLAECAAQLWERGYELRRMGRGRYRGGSRRGRRSGYRGNSRWNRSETTVQDIYDEYGNVIIRQIFNRRHRGDFRRNRHVNTTCQIYDHYGNITMRNVCRRHGGSISHNTFIYN